MSAHEHIIYYTPVAAFGTDKVTYNRHQINAAISHALAILKHGEPVGEDKFPHAYKKAWLAAHSHAHAPIFAFPILRDGVYDGTGPAGFDRVLFGSVAKDYKSADYVAVVSVDAAAATATSDGAHPPHHVFPDTSINLDTKTPPHHFDTSALKEGESHNDAPLLPPDNRELIGHADVKHGFKE